MIDLSEKDEQGIDTYRRGYWLVDQERHLNRSQTIHKPVWTVRTMNWTVRKQTSYFERFD